MYFIFHENLLKICTLNVIRKTTKTENSKIKHATLFWTISRVLGIFLGNFAPAETFVGQKTSSIKLK